MKNNQTLKSKVLQGGIYLTIRQLMGVGVSLVSVLVIARVLGPELYGVVAVASGMLFFTFWTGKLGLEVYLIRQPDLPEDAPEQVLAFYNTMGVGLCVLLWLAVPLYSLFTGQTVVAQVLKWLVPVVWLEMVSSVSISMMERELRFSQVGLIETLAQVSNSILAVSLVLMNWGYWGPIAGIGLQYILLALMASYCYRISWRWRWRWQFIRSALRYSLAYCGANFIGSLKGLTLPLFVSPLAGLEAVGIISIGIRFSDQLGILRMVVARMSISALAKLIGNPDSTRRAISRGIVYQGLLVAPIFAVFSCCAAWVIPLVFGKDWLPSLYVFPFIAFATLINTVFNLHFSALYAAGHNREVAKFNLWHVGVFWLACWILLPRLGVWGFAVAELVTVLSYYSIHRSLAKLYGSPNYWDGFCLIAATAPALFAGPWLTPIISLGILTISYALLFLLRPRVRGIPAELYSAWQSRSVSTSP
ncbi:oligosaccharide flippase family protein [Trichocoleus sp. ST-U3]